MLQTNHMENYKLQNMSNLIFFLEIIFPFILGLFFMVISFLKNTKNKKIYRFISIVILLFSSLKIFIEKKQTVTIDAKNKEKYHLTYKDSIFMVEKFKNNPEYLMIKNEKQKEIYDMYLKCFFEQIKNSNMTEDELFKSSNIIKLNKPCLEEMDLIIDSLERNSIIHK